MQHCADAKALKLFAVQLLEVQSLAQLDKFKASDTSQANNYTSHLQGFLAVQYLLAGQLYIKLALGYAQAKLQPSDVVTLGVKLGGTVTKPNQPFKSSGAFRMKSRQKRRTSGPRSFAHNRPHLQSLTFSATGSKRTWEYWRERWPPSPAG